MTGSRDITSISLTATLVVLFAAVSIAVLAVTNAFVFFFVEQQWRSGAQRDLEVAGNVLRPHTSFKISVRLPPTCDPDMALGELTSALTNDPPYGAKVEFLDAHSGPGWNAPEFAPWLEAALTDASLAVFGDDYRAFVMQLIDEQQQLIEQLGLGVKK